MGDLHEPPQREVSGEGVTVDVTLERRHIGLERPYLTGSEPLWELVTRLRLIIEAQETARDDFALRRLERRERRVQAMVDARMMHDA